MQRIIKGDIVVVIAGRDKGMRGAVLKVLRKKDKNNVKMIVSGVNVRSKHKKPISDNPGGVIKKECLIDSSNLSLLCKHTDKPSKVGYKYLDGKKVRIYKKSMECVE